MHYEIVGRLHEGAHPAGVYIKWMVIESWGPGSVGLSVSFEMYNPTPDYTLEEAERTVRKAIRYSATGTLPWITPGSPRWKIAADDLVTYFTRERYSFSIGLALFPWFRTLPEHVTVTPSLLPKGRRGYWKLTFVVHPQP